MKLLHRITILLVGALSLSLSIQTARADEMVVEMLNKSSGQTYAYAPDLIRLQPGDSVMFRPTDKGHNAITIDGMLPDGAARIDVGFNKEIKITFDRPGIYGVKCVPHVGLGMVGLIIVGEPNDTNAIREATAKLPPKARARMEELLRQLES